MVEELGSDAYAYGTLHTTRSKAGDKLVTMRVNARQVPMKGETIYLDIPAEEAHVFSAADGRRVSGDAQRQTTSGSREGSTRLS